MWPYSKGLILAHARLQEILSNPNLSDEVKDQARENFLEMARYLKSRAQFISTRTFREGRKTYRKFEELLRQFDPNLAERYMSWRQKEYIDRLDDFIARDLDANSILFGDERFIELIGGETDWSRNREQQQHINAIREAIVKKIQSKDPVQVEQGLRLLVDELNKIRRAEGSKMKDVRLQDLLLKPDGDPSSTLVTLRDGRTFKLGFDIRIGTIAELSEIPVVRQAALAKLAAEGRSYETDYGRYLEIYNGMKRDYLNARGIPADLMGITFLISRETENRLAKRNYGGGLLESWSGTVTLDRGRFEGGLFTPLDISLLRSQYVEQSNFHELLHFVHPHPYVRDSESNVIEELNNYFAQMTEGVIDYDFGMRYSLEHILGNKIPQYLRPGEGDHALDSMLPHERLVFIQRTQAAFKSIVGLKILLERILKKMGMDPALALAFTQRVLWNARSLDDLLVVQKYLRNPARLEALMAELVGAKAVRVTDHGVIEGFRNIVEANRFIAERVVNAAVADLTEGRVEEAKARIVAYQESLANVRDRRKVIIPIEKLLARKQAEEQSLLQRLSRLRAQKSTPAIQEEIELLAGQMQRIQRQAVMLKVQQAKQMRNDATIFNQLMQMIDQATAGNVSHAKILKNAHDELLTKKWEEITGRLDAVPLDDRPDLWLSILSNEIPGVVELANRIHGYLDPNRAVERIRELVGDIREQWLSIILARITYEMKAGRADRAFYRMKREIHRFFEIFVTQEERNKNILTENPSGMMLYDFPYELTHQLLRRFILGIPGETLPGDDKLERVELVHRFLQDIRKMFQEARKNDTVNVPKLDEEVAARVLQVIMWEGKEDPVIRLYIENHLMDRETRTFTEHVKDPKLVNRASGIYMAELSSEPLNLEDLKQHAESMTFEQAFQVDLDGRIYLGTGARDTGSETFGEHFHYLLHNHPPDHRGQVTVVPSLHDPNHDGVLQATLPVILANGEEGIARVGGDGAIFITTKFGMTKYYYDELINESLFDINQGQDARGDLFGRGIENLSYSQVYGRANQLAMIGQGFEFEYVDTRDSSVKVRVEFKPWKELEGLSRYDLGAFLPMAVPMQAPVAVRSELRAMTIPDLLAYKIDGLTEMSSTDRLQIRRVFESLLRSESRVEAGFMDALRGVNQVVLNLATPQSENRLRYDTPAFIDASGPTRQIVVNAEKILDIVKKLQANDATRARAFELAGLILQIWIHDHEERHVYYEPWIRDIVYGKHSTVPLAMREQVYDVMQEVTVYLDTMNAMERAVRQNPELKNYFGNTMQNIEVLWRIATGLDMQSALSHMRGVHDEKGMIEEVLLGVLSQGELSSGKLAQDILVGKMIDEIMGFKQFIRVYMTESQIRGFNGSQIQILETLMGQYGNALELIRSHELAGKISIDNVLKGHISVLFDAEDNVAMSAVQPHAMREEVIGFVTDRDRLRSFIKDQVQVAILAAMLGADQFNQMINRNGGDGERISLGLHRMRFVAEVLKSQAIREYFMAAA
ncbi:MAG: hypothetical protein JW893_01530 [Candidatus Omnitrophica bacterium]|nr:hypothetical protein [Candidatus Omnitrophota bacterium]